MSRGASCDLSAGSGTAEEAGVGVVEGAGDGSRSATTGAVLGADAVIDGASSGFLNVGDIGPYTECRCGVIEVVTADNEGSSLVTGRGCMDRLRVVMVFPGFI